MYLLLFALLLTNPSVSILFLIFRCVSGRNRMSKYFAESIPYFDLSEYSLLDKELKMREADNWIKDRMPDAGAINDVVFFCSKYALHH